MTGRVTAWAGCVAVAVLLSAPSGAVAQPLPDPVPIDSWGPAGTVNAVARQGDTIYVGGSFNYVGPGTGPFAAFTVDAAQPGVVATGFDGTIAHVAALPGGGWIVVGDIRQTPTSTRQIVRLDAEGRIDPSFYTEISGSVRALASDGTRVFIAGYLNAVNGSPRTAVAAVDSTTGALLPWNPIFEQASATPEVTSLLVHQGTLYAGGRFTAVNGAARNGFAAIDAATGTTMALTQSALATVEAMTATGDTVYLVGRRSSFDTGGVALSIASGAVLPWTLPSTFTNITRIAATPSRVYAASFDAVRALDPVTGATIGAPLITNASINAMAVEGDLLVIGSTRYTNGITPEVTTFDAGNGAPRAWSLLLNDRVEAISVRGGTVALAGAFRSAGGVVRHNLFGLDIRTGRPTAFAPLVQGEVAALATVGQVLVAGGTFTRIDDTDRHGVAALDTDTGALLPWAPLERGGWVTALAVVGNALHLGGTFSVVDGYSRPHLASVSLASGGVTAWLPVPDRPVQALTASGDTLLAVGEFESLAEGPRGGGAAFSTSTGGLTTWDPRADGVIRGVAIAGTTIGVVGWFNTLGTIPRPGVGFLDGQGTVLPLTFPHSSVQATAIAGLGEHFFVGGSFTSEGVTRHLMAISTVDGVEIWGPAFQDAWYSPDVRTLARYPDLLVVGGVFSRVSDRRVLNIALFTGGRSEPPTHLGARVTGSVASVWWSAPAGTVPTGYIVEAGTAPGATDVGRFVVGGPSASGALAPGTYYVRVRAMVNAVEGRASSEVILTVPAGPMIPAAPAGLTAFVRDGRVTLSWIAAPGNAESYVIEAGLSPGQSNLARFDTGTLDTSFSAPVGPGTYYVRVRGRNTFGTGTASNEAVVVVP